MYGDDTGEGAYTKTYAHQVNALHRANKMDRDKQERNVNKENEM